MDPIFTNFWTNVDAILGFVLGVKCDQKGGFVLEASGRLAGVREKRKQE
jgi:hypothetical protein